MILAKEKSEGVERVENGYMLFYIGVPNNERAKADVACLESK